MNNINEFVTPTNNEDTKPSKLDNEQIYARIFEAIVAHRLIPGTHLKEDILCDIFNVGRTRIRAVLSRLVADHVVDILPNKGAFISQPTINDAHEVFRARRLIEAHLVLRAAENPDERARSSLQDHLAQQQGALEAGDHSVEIKSCGDFHQVLADIAQSPIIARFMYELTARSALIVAIYERYPSSHCELEEHQQLADLILAGRGDDAVQLMEKHLIGIENRLDLAPQKKVDNSLRRALEF